MDHRALLLYRHLWKSLQVITPWHITLLTVNALRDPRITSVPYKAAQLIEDPICVLRCDMRALLTPVMLQIVLDVRAAMSVLCFVLQRRV